MALPSSTSPGGPPFPPARIGGGCKPSMAISCQTPSIRRWIASTTAMRIARSGCARSICARSRCSGAVSNALAIAAWTSESLSGKTRNSVPSAMPAASAICAVVTAAPWMRSSGTVAAMMLARRASGERGAARATCTA